MKDGRAQLLAVLGVFWLVAAWFMPPVQDEAYYFDWATRLAGGYFDHPPAVAWMAATSRLAPGMAFVARLGTLFVAALLVGASARFFRILGTRQANVRLTALLLAFGSFAGIAAGFLTTPDTILMLSWVLAASEAALALKGQGRRWLTAGAATGLGLLAKYTMLLMGPVFLWALLRTRKGRGLKTPWPYLGGLVALLVFLPNLVWNAQNDWITFRFQLRHGLAMERPVVEEAPRLPAPEKAQIDSVEWNLGQVFRDLEEVTAKEEKRPGPLDELLKALNRYIGFYASQFALWGAFLIGAPMLWRRRRSEGLSVDEDAKPLLQALVWAPLIVFGLLSLVSKVEANWSAMYVFGAALVLAPFYVRMPRLFAFAFVANLLIAGAIVLQARTGLLPTRPHRDRMLAETHGFQDLAAYVRTLDGPVFAETYQLVAMTRFYAPGVEPNQWPGLTRASEYVINPAWTRVSTADLVATGGFWLIVTAPEVPTLKGFTPSSMAQLRDCKGEKLQVISQQAAANAASRCKKPIHEWYLIRYVTQGS